MAVDLSKYKRFEDVSLRVADNGGFILTYTGIYQAKGGKDTDNVSRDWGKTMVFSETESDKALSTLLSLSGKSVKTPTKLSNS